MVDGIEPGRFGLIAEIEAGDAHIVVGEAVYVVDAAQRAIEIALSIAEEWRRNGAGSALLADVERRAADLGADRIFGDTLAGNREMLGLARNRGYRFTHPPGDWKLVRFEKPLFANSDALPGTINRATRSPAAAH